MTTILIDWNTKTLYTDSRCTNKRFAVENRSLKVIETFSDNFMKIWRTDDPYYFFTGTGSVGAIEKFLKTGKHKHLKNTYVWEVDAVKSKVWSHSSEGRKDITYSEGVVTNGSGVYCVETALRFTDNPDEAMEKIADPYTGGKIHKYKVDWSYLYEDIH